mgnify:CR=1 FL=1
MISNELIVEALFRNDKVVSCQFLGEGIFLLRMEGYEFPMKTNSYGVMKIVDPKLFNSEFSVRNFVVGMDEIELVAEKELDEHDMQCAKAEYEYHEANWEALESDDGHRELYEV